MTVTNTRCLRHPGNAQRPPVSGRRTRRDPRAATRGLALTELLLSLPLFLFVIAALMRIAEAQSGLVPTQAAARYATWTQARTRTAPPPDETVRAADAPPTVRLSVDSRIEGAGEGPARQAAPGRPAVVAADLSDAGRATATAVAREGGASSRLLPSTTVTARVSLMAGTGIANPRPGWMPALGDGPARFWQAAYGGEGP